jgi:hypothetical protein
MSAAHGDSGSFLSDQAWKQLADLEALHQAVCQKHDRVVRSLDEASLSSDQRNLQVAWNQYRSVVADLSRVTEDIESFRLGCG